MPRKPRPKHTEPEVMAWLREDDTRGPKAASLQFPGVSINTIKSWQRRARLDGRSPRDNLTLLSPAPAPPAPEAPAPSPLESLTRKQLHLLAMTRRLVRLAEPINPSIESLSDSAKILTGLLDRTALIEGLDPVKEQDPTSDEGRKQLIAAMGAFPAEVLEAALAAKRSA
jgi:hypothetical protein